VNYRKIYISLGIFRTILGFGIGGEYPLSATLAAEGAKPESRGRQMALVFSMQGWGYLLAPLVGKSHIRLLLTTSSILSLMLVL